MGTESADCRMVRPPSFHIHFPLKLLALAFSFRRKIIPDGFLNMWFKHHLPALNPNVPTTLGPEAVCRVADAIGSTCPPQLRKPPSVSWSLKHLSVLVV